jgi:hypothetical protein
MIPVPPLDQIERPGEREVSRLNGLQCFGAPGGIAKEIVPDSSLVAFRRVDSRYDSIGS